MIKRWDCTVPSSQPATHVLTAPSRRFNSSLTHLVSFAIIPTGDATGNGAQPIILREILAEFQVSRLSSRPQLMGLLAQRGRFPFGLPNSRLKGEICNGTPFLDCNMATKISTYFNKDMSEILPLWFFPARDAAQKLPQPSPRPVEFHAVSMEADGEGVVDHHMSLTRGQSGGLGNLKVFD